MSIIATADLNSLIDDLTLGYRYAKGNSTIVYGMGEDGDAFGLADKLSDIKTTLQAAAGSNADPLVDLGAPLDTLKASFSISTIFGARARAFLARLDAHVRRRDGVNGTSLYTLLSYLNTGAGGPWAALQHPDFRTIYNKAKGGSNYPAPYHLYFEVLQGATYANALGKFIASGAGTGAYTAGSVSVSGSVYAGGFPYLVTSGLAGSGVVTVTGTAFDPSTMTAITGRTWTVTVAGNGSAVLAVGTAPANSLILATSNITIAAGITAGTFYVEGRRPTGRPLL